MSDEGVSWVAGGPTYGAFWRIGTGALRVLCGDPIMAIKLYWHYKGEAEIWCATCPRAATWAMYNLGGYLVNAIVATNPNDIYDIDQDEAFDIGYKVVAVSEENYKFEVKEL